MVIIGPAYDTKKRDTFLLLNSLYFKGNFGFKSSPRLFADASTLVRKRQGFKG